LSKKQFVGGVFGAFLGGVIAVGFVFEAFGILSLVFFNKVYIL